MAGEHRHVRSDLEGRDTAKIQREQATTILVCPYWNSRPWFPVLPEMAVDIPLVILPRKDLLQASDETTHPLCQDGSFLLSVWKLSGMAIEAREFRRKCENFSWPETEFEICKLSLK